MRSKGQIAYRAYVECVGGLSINNEVLPPWEDLPDLIKEAWQYAADEVTLSEEAG